MVSWKLNSQLIDGIYCPRCPLGSVPDTSEALRQASQEHRLSVAEAGARLLGFLALNKGFNEIDALFVEPDLQRQGIASQLVEAAADAAFSRGRLQLHVVSGHEAESFYAAVGFEPADIAAHEIRAGDGNGEAIKPRSELIVWRRRPPRQSRRPAPHSRVPAETAPQPQ